MKSTNLSFINFSWTKKNALVTILFILLLNLSNAQSVGINTLTPDPSAALDIQSTTGGLLMPRMTSAEMNALVNPPDGLMLFNTDLGNSMMFVQGTAFELYNRVTTSAVTILSGLSPAAWLSIDDVVPTDILGTDAYRFQMDFTDVNEVRVIANVSGLTLTTNALDIAMQYSTNNGTTWSYLNSATFGPGLSISADGLITTPWTAIDAGAQQDVQLRLVGTTDALVSFQVGFGLIMLEMR
ncbi:hypothetical protein [Maribacter forsetii]|uniref:hypothetical protein n=1 Tax=Maribacter forsetii TaxID=444515 RepID=UPI00056D5EC1|nr:hypothetical protein [Maribacter forsetii]